MFVLLFILIKRLTELYSGQLFYCGRILLHRLDYPTLLVGNSNNGNRFNPFMNSRSVPPEYRQAKGLKFPVYRPGANLLSDRLDQNLW